MEHMQKENESLKKEVQEMTTGKKDEEWEKERGI